MKWLAIGFGILFMAGVLRWRRRARREQWVNPDA